MRVVVLLHGMAAALAVATAVHLLWLLPKRRFAPRGAALGFTLSLAALYVLGWFAYPAFRVEIRRDWVAAPADQWLANLFDVKEFLSWGALMAGLAVGLPLLRGGPVELELRRAYAWAVWFVLAVLVFNTVVGLLVSSVRFL